MVEINSGLSKLWAIMGGVAASLILMLLLSVPAALAVYYSSLSEAILPALALIINSLSLLAGGFLAGRLSGSCGLLLGLVVGVLATALMLLVGDTAETAAALACFLLAAMIGGVFGVR